MLRPRRAAHPGRRGPASGARRLVWQPPGGRVAASEMQTSVSPVPVPVPPSCAVLGRTPSPAASSSPSPNAALRSPCRAGSVPAVTRSGRLPAGSLACARVCACGHLEGEGLPPAYPGWPSGSRLLSFLGHLSTGGCCAGRRIPAPSSLARLAQESGLGLRVQAPPGAAGEPLSLG